MVLSLKLLKLRRNQPQYKELKVLTILKLEIFASPDDKPIEPKNGLKKCKSLKQPQKRRPEEPKAGQN